MKKWKCNLQRQVQSKFASKRPPFSKFFFFKGPPVRRTRVSKPPHTANINSRGHAQWTFGALGQPPFNLVLLLGFWKVFLCEVVPLRPRGPKNGALCLILAPLSTLDPSSRVQLQTEIVEPLLELNAALLLYGSTLELSSFVQSLNL